MKKIISLLAIFLVLVSCKDETVKKPNRLIEKDEMVNIMYDLSLLEGIKYQNPTSLDTFKINPKKYIYKKYKVDSLQFAKSNTYYASNYEEYANIIDQVNDRLTKNKTAIAALIKAEAKKNKKKKPVEKSVSPTSKMIDSLEINQRKRL
ncbi:DUF4296 domain-containing protein [Flavobacterium gawalongense]|uniref:DUF4296 domain-containing protein n=1 Tax=Flavobacterium gawalongense TaxID=2594432 RepID=A0ABY3CJM7_9FLAO|nr:DUF4296 domain-containing protein [Flavobacterium gawalongense]TRX01230.1 DUF4296 domain-containing protein [Flavobacterium gawalongense]TRX05245.1 DUF4296 domain-containing protein [Flavobacterium gawalongense]TRX09148.1 DUF4296 domain-containing protein [Flavobacterium gawalongense]TRX26674.1 DUF4296 domain-containing protein [Flavobacterium gawalongense]